MKTSPFFYEVSRLKPDLEKKQVRKGYLNLFLSIILTVILFSHLTYPLESGTIWAQVLDSSQNPLKDVTLVISTEQGTQESKFMTNNKGLIKASGFSPGKYTVKLGNPEYKSFREEKLFLNPGEYLLLKITLVREDKKGNSECRVVHINYSSASQDTLINSQQIKEMPSGHNTGSLIENQDLSAVTDRIDVGGLWSGIPALFSARGASSWTQNIFLLNGMDITDPYQGGTPLLYADIFSLDHTRLTNAGHPPEYIHPGGYLNLVTRGGTNDYHGSLSGFYIHHSLQNSNITKSLQNEGIDENHTFDFFTEGNFSFSGPLISEKLSFFTSVTGFDLSRDLAEFDGENKSSLLSGLLSLRYQLSPKSTFRLLWTGQSLNHSSLGAGREIPFSSTHITSQHFNVIQALWDSHINHQHQFRAAMGYVQAENDYDFQEKTTLPYSREILYNTSLGGAAPFAEENLNKKFIFLFNGESIFSKFLGFNHTLRYGLNIQISSSSQDIDVMDNIHLLFFEGQPIQTARYNTPVSHEEKGSHLNLYLQDTLTFSNLFSFYIGAHLSSARAWVPDTQEDQNKINWLNISPRLGLIIPLSRAKTSVLKLSYARYFNTLPLKYLSYGNADALGSLIYAWDDKNHDLMFQENEQGELLRREGPLYSSIDPHIQRPYADEAIISYKINFKSTWRLALSGFYRKFQLAVNTKNGGVPFSEYDPLYYIDSGDDQIPTNDDDLIFTLYNQKKESLGKDFYLLSNIEADTRAAFYYGLDVNLVKNFNDDFSIFFSFTATNTVGTTNPGNTALENDIGVIGSLFDNPNAMINTEGRPCFDRGYTARLGFKYSAPFGFLLSGIVKYYDGQPFSRKIIIKGLNQGPFIIQAHPSGVSRYEFNSTVDLRLEKRFPFGNSRLRLMLDGFNVLNMGLATQENEWTGPEFPLRYATEIQSPRVFRLGISYEF
jgi:hypothetical protein